MYKIQKSVTLMGLAFVFCAALPVGSNAEIHKLEAESNVKDEPNKPMLDCVNDTCFKPITDCIKACKGTKPQEKAICYSACAQKVATINKCYGTCETGNIKDKEE